MDEGFVVGDFGEASRDSRSAWAVATFAEKLRGSPFAQEITYSQIYRYASQASDDSNDHRELLELIAREALLLRAGVDVAIHDEGGRAVVVERRNSKNAHASRRLENGVDERGHRLAREDEHPQQ